MASLQQTAPDSTLSARDTPFGAEVLQGLSRTPKTLSPWLFYDAAGSALFEQITALPEYYVTRTERAILAAHAGSIVREASEGHPLAIVELGAGTASKTGLLLQAAVAQQGSIDYYAIDVSETALDEAREHLEREIPGVCVHPRVADYTEGLGLIEAEARRKLVLFIGSSIGNFDPGDATELLAAVRAELQPGDQLLLGADQVKPVEILLAAYDDAEGVTAAFNLNVLHRINAELDADFYLPAFAHEARWNSRESRIEMHLRSTVQQRVTLAALDLTVAFEAGETIHTENSYKFTDEQVRRTLGDAGFTAPVEWKDELGWFGVYLAAAR